MAEAQVRVRGAALKAPAHRKVTLKAGSLVLTLPIASPEVTHSNMGADWVTIPRPGREPLMRKGFYRQREQAIDVTFDLGGKPVDALLFRLAQISHSTSPTSVAYGPLEGGVWWLTDFTIKSSRREFGTNAITRAVVSLNLTAAPANSYRTTVSTTTKPKPTKPSPKAPKKPRVYVVKRGDTLTGIAVRVYGDAGKFRDIAKANKISNPNKIQVGQRLVLP